MHHRPTRLALSPIWPAILLSACAQRPVAQATVATHPAQATVATHPAQATVATHLADATVVAFQAPPSGPTARLLMRSTLQAGDRYGVFLADSSNDCQGLRAVGSGSHRLGDPGALTISAPGVRTVEVMLLRADRSTCRARWSFYPSAGRTYLVSTRNTVEGCSAMIFDATDVDAMKVEPSLLRRDVPGNLCVPLAQSKTITQLTGPSDTGKTVPNKPAAAPRTAAVVDADLEALIGR